MFKCPCIGKANKDKFFEIKKNNNAQSFHSSINKMPATDEEEDEDRYRKDSHDYDEEDSMDNAKFIK